MYLINAKTYRLEYFMDSDIPPYAILSHTWGPGEEVTFQDMQNTNGTGLPVGKPSFSKIRFTCEQALAENLQYAWVDTCCINKQSSAELSEAINSMFRWYNKAQVCYALLSDVHCPHVSSPEDDDIAIVPTLPDVASTLAPSRWFERGWTLQELIAPSDLRFYDGNLELISSRQVLACQLSAITGIHVDVLDWPSQLDSHWGRQSVRGTLETLQKLLQKFSIAERMAWAAARQTSRLEDISYSLLGIFDVNMPMLYGEGNRAFVRLQQEIMRTSKDHSIFAWDRAQAPGPSDFRPYGDFAEHPSQFCLAIAQGRCAGAYWPPYSDAGFELTNGGLRLTVPIVSSLGTTWAVLNCGVSNDLTGPLALSLMNFRRGTLLYTTHAPGGKRIATIPVELLLRAETKTIVVRSDAELWDGPRYGRSTRTVRTVSFRVNVQNASRRTKVLASRPSGHCERNFAVGGIKPENKVRQDITISLPGVNGGASGVRLWTAMSREAETDHRVWNVAFCFLPPRLGEDDDPNESSDDPSRGYLPRVAVSPGSEDLQSLCDRTAKQLHLQQDAKEATRTAEGMTAHASMRIVDGWPNYWQVDIKFTAEAT
ncbi:hypothetical protein LTR17_015043 [Elasticomyces elasticus]|nr:hypothetical protein LTR17_015043 [Elasticomyces elasticus]